MSIFVRLGTEPTPDDTPLTLPSITMLCRKLDALPWYLKERGIVLDRALFEQAESEMISLRSSQGYAAIARAQLPQRNFLLFGTPIVLGE